MVEPTPIAPGIDTLAPQPVLTPAGETAKQTFVLGEAAEPQLRPFQYHASDEDLADLVRGEAGLGAVVVVGEGGAGLGAGGISGDGRALGRDDRDVRRARGVERLDDLDDFGGRPRPGDDDDPVVAAGQLVLSES